MKKRIVEYNSDNGNYYVEVEQFGSGKFDFGYHFNVTRPSGEHIDRNVETKFYAAFYRDERSAALHAMQLMKCEFKGICCPEMKKALNTHIAEFGGKVKKC